MTHAIVLIEAERTAIKTLGGALADVEGVADPDARIEAVQRLIAEETRVSLLIGVAVGYELAHVLNERQGEG